MILAKTWKDDFTKFLQSYALYICLGIVFAIVATIVVVYLIKNRKKAEPVKNYNEDVNLWVDSLGGKDNIISLSSNGSRLSVSLKDYSLLKEDIKALGVSSIIKMSDRVILVVENSAAEIQNNIEKSL